MKRHKSDPLSVLVSDTHFMARKKWQETREAPKNLTAIISFIDRAVWNRIDNLGGVDLDRVKYNQAFAIWSESK